MTKDPTAEQRARTMTTRKVPDAADTPASPPDQTVDQPLDQLPETDASVEQRQTGADTDVDAKPDGKSDPITLTPDLSTREPAPVDLDAEDVDAPQEAAKIPAGLGRGPGVQQKPAGAQARKAAGGGGKANQAIEPKGKKSANPAQKARKAGKPAQAGQRQPANAKKGAPPAKPQQPQPAEPRVLPTAQTVGMRRRHWGLLISFVMLVVIPIAAFSYYLWTFAEDQYGSTTGFAVRSEESGSASDLFTGLLSPAGGATGRDSDILYEYVRSQEIVEDIDAELDLRAHYSKYWPSDWMFSIWPDVSLEWLVWYWDRITRVSYDQPTGLLEVHVVAFDPDYAQAVARAVVAKSQARINDISIQAREDAMRYALEDLEAAQEKLKVARENLTKFRSRTGIVDPAADIQTRLGVMNNLQQQLADSLIEYDLLRDTASPTDPRVTSAQRRIEVIRERIAAERLTFASDSSELGGLDEDYPSLIAEFESLTVDREFAEETYRVSLAALDLARDNAARQTRYLATYIQPTKAQSSEFPRRFVLTGLAMVFLLLFWGIVALVYYSIRDRG